MLVLGRKVGGRIVIGEGIVLTILSVRGRQVRIGIEAPRDTRVRRGELEPAEAHEADTEEQRETGHRDLPPEGSQTLSVRIPEAPATRLAPSGG